MHLQPLELSITLTYAKVIGRQDVRALREDVYRTADGVAALQHRRRAADDLDALDGGRVDPAEVLRRPRSVGRRVEAAAIEQLHDSLRT